MSISPISPDTPFTSATFTNGIAVENSPIFTKSSVLTVALRPSATCCRWSSVSTSSRLSARRSSCDSGTTASSSFVSLRFCTFQPATEPVAIERRKRSKAEFVSTALMPSITSGRPASAGLSTPVVDDRWPSSEMIVLPSTVLPFQRLSRC